MEVQTLKVIRRNRKHVALCLFLGPIALDAAIFDEAGEHTFEFTYNLSIGRNIWRFSLHNELPNE